MPSPGDPQRRIEKSFAGSAFAEREVPATVLITGATGFIGRHLVHALGRAGYRVVGLARRLPPPDPVHPWLRYAAVDFAKAVDADAWLPYLTGVDMVINAVGIFRERGEQTFDVLHVRAPCALFSACVAANAKRVVQISALGADSQAQSRYHQSKKRADDFLASLPLCWVIVQPSIVYGSGGASARLFTALASLPIIPLPGRGDQRIQPIHVDDAAQAIAALLHHGAYHEQRVALVGPNPTTLSDFLRELRSALGMRPPRFIPVPMRLVDLGARFAGLLPGSLFDRASLQMLERGNEAVSTATEALLGRIPLPIAHFIPADEAPATRTSAKVAWLLPILRLALALVWIWSGIVSLGLYPLEASYGLLARSGITGALASVSLFGAALLDIAFGVTSLVLRHRRALWLLQMAVIVGYTLVISWALPEFWLHPFGPVIKNAVVLATLLTLYVLEEREGT